ncbi:hypothetical protein SSS_03907 [Sarcoptes scabiei]|uniref:FERM domain-containing protein n=1 Tax=Sarcoptes scabiei TaxID=52283 RepID=A0A834R0B8_SARSC|nr:hypothetical protein SSS_03907 [Sarcoptes scabiei]
MELIHLPDHEIYSYEYNEEDEEQKNFTSKQVIEKIYEDYFEIDSETLELQYHNVLALWIVCDINEENLGYGSKNNVDQMDQIDSNQCDQSDSKAYASQLRLQLKDDHRLIEVKTKMMSLLKRKNFICRFRLGRNGYLRIEEEESIKDHKLLKFLYLEAKENIRNNFYPLSNLQRVELDKIQFMLEEDAKTSTFYKVFKQKTRTLSCRNSLKRMRNQFQLLKYARNQDGFEEKSKIDLYREYLQKCHQFVPCYGGFFYEGQMERSIRESILHKRFYDKKILVAINQNGLHLINLECPKIMFSIPFHDLCYGILRPKKDCHHYCFYLKISSDKTKQIFTHYPSFIEKTLQQFIINEK